MESQTLATGTVVSIRLGKNISASVLMVCISEIINRDSYKPQTFIHEFKVFIFSKQLYTIINYYPLDKA